MAGTGAGSVSISQISANMGPGIHADPNLAAYTRLPEQSGVSGQNQQNMYEFAFGEPPGPMVQRKNWYGSRNATNYLEEYVGRNVQYIADQIEALATSATKDPFLTVIAPIFVTEEQNFLFKVVEGIKIPFGIVPIGGIARTQRKKVREWASNKRRKELAATIHAEFAKDINFGKKAWEDELRMLAINAQFTFKLDLTIWLANTSYMNRVRGGTEQMVEIDKYKQDELEQRFFVRGALDKGHILRTFTDLQNVNSKLDTIIIPPTSNIHILREKGEKLNPQEVFYKREIEDPITKEKLDLMIPGPTSYTTISSNGKDVHCFVAENFYFEEGGEAIQPLAQRLTIGHVYPITYSKDYRNKDNYHHEEELNNIKVLDYKSKRNEKKSYNELIYAWCYNPQTGEIADTVRRYFEEKFTSEDQQHPIPYFADPANELFDNDHPLPGVLNRNVPIKEMRDWREGFFLFSYNIDSGKYFIPKFIGDFMLCYLPNDYILRAAQGMSGQLANREAVESNIQRYITLLDNISEQVPTRAYLKAVIQGVYKFHVSTDATGFHIKGNKTPKDRMDVWKTREVEEVYQDASGVVPLPDYDIAFGMKFPSGYNSWEGIDALAKNASSPASKKWPCADEAKELQKTLYLVFKNTEKGTPTSDYHHEMFTRPWFHRTSKFSTWHEGFTKPTAPTWIRFPAPTRLKTPTKSAMDILSEQEGQELEIMTLPSIYSVLPEKGAQFDILIKEYIDSIKNLSKPGSDRLRTLIMDAITSSKGNVTALNFPIVRNLMLNPQKGNLGKSIAVLQYMNSFAFSGFMKVLIILEKIASFTKKRYVEVTKTKVPISANPVMKLFLDKLFEMLTLPKDPSYIKLLEKTKQITGTTDEDKANVDALNLKYMYKIAYKMISDFINFVYVLGSSKVVNANKKLFLVLNWLYDKLERILYLTEEDSPKDMNPSNIFSSCILYQTINPVENADILDAKKNVLDAMNFVKNISLKVSDLTTTEIKKITMDGNKLKPVPDDWDVFLLSGEEYKKLSESIIDTGVSDEAMEIVDQLNILSKAIRKIFEREGIYNVSFNYSSFYNTKSKNEIIFDGKNIELLPFTNEQNRRDLLPLTERFVDLRNQLVNFIPGITNENVEFVTDLDSSEMDETEYLKPSFSTLNILQAKPMRSSLAMSKGMLQYILNDKKGSLILPSDPGVKHEKALDLGLLETSGNLVMAVIPDYITNSIELMSIKDLSEVFFHDHGLHHLPVGLRLQSKHMKTPTMVLTPEMQLTKKGDPRVFERDDAPAFGPSVDQVRYEMLEGLKEVRKEYQGPWVSRFRYINDQSICNSFLDRNNYYSICLERNNGKRLADIAKYGGRLTNAIGWRLFDTGVYYSAIVMKAGGDTVKIATGQTNVVLGKDAATKFINIYVSMSTGILPVNPDNIAMIPYFTPLRHWGGMNTENITDILDWTTNIESKPSWLWTLGPVSENLYEFNMHFLNEETYVNRLDSHHPRIFKKWSSSDYYRYIFKDQIDELIAINRGRKDYTEIPDDVEACWSCPRGILLKYANKNIGYQYFAGTGHDSDIRTGIPGAELIFNAIGDEFPPTEHSKNIFEQ